jgi:hypothetical protein
VLELAEVSSESGLQKLITAEVAEDEQLDFKRDPYPNDADGKKELVRDVAAMANARGGYILLGIDEKDNVAVNLVGVEQGDIVARAVQQTCATGIDERIPGLNVFAVPLASGRSVVVIRIPASHRAPHAVTISTGKPFWKRRGESKGEMNMAEVREVVMRLETMEAKFERFLASRQESITGTLGEPPIPRKPQLQVMVTPMSLRTGFIDTADPELRKTVSGGTKTGAFDVSASGPRPRPTYHGIGWQSAYGGRVELYRNGHYELVLPLKEPEFVRKMSDHRWLNPLSVVDHTLTMVKSASRYISHAGVADASLWCVTINLFDVDNTLIGSESNGLQPVSGNPGQVLRDHRHLIGEPQPIDWSRPIEPQVAAALDIVWNAFGFEKAAYFNADGTYRPPK